MWYFTWNLGVGFAVACGVINVLWLENDHRFDDDIHKDDQVFWCGSYLRSDNVRSIRSFVSNTFGVLRMTR